MMTDIAPSTPRSAKFCPRWMAAGLVLTFSAASHAQQAVGTAFTYQGMLNQSGVPVHATADFQFSLFNAASAGNLVAGPISVNNVTVADGLFTVSLDFGAAAFGDQARWLSIAVRSPAGAGAFTPLATRQRLTAAPYALKVPGIDGFSLNAADGSPVDALLVDNVGNVGIGVPTPTHPLHVRASIPIINVQDSDSTGAQQSGYVRFADNTNTERGYVGFGSQTTSDLTLQNLYASGGLHLGSVAGIQLAVAASGNVGIGTVAPTSKLDVRGAVVVANQGDQADLLWLSSERSWVFRQEGTGAVTALKLQSIGGGGNKNFVIQTDGFVGIGTTSPAAKLDVNGTTRTTVLEITGADLAEKFPASERLEPGMVAAIDPANPGKLCLARGTYNRCVAGVVSGANDFAAGAVLGNLPGSDEAPAVALSGRVYVWCDASSGAIRPGDLLTTSDVAGHAMKAVDRENAHGAVIGKAMTALKAGRGLVLVLVNLQ